MADTLAIRLRGFGPLGIVAILAILFTGNIMLPGMWVVPVGALLVLLWVHLSQTPWSALGFVRPASWAATIAGGIAFGAAFKLLMKSAVMPLLHADPVNHAYHFLAGNRAMLPAAIFAMLNAGFAEETVFRGFAFERLEKIFGASVASRIAIVLLTSAWFAFSHLASQGVPGVEQAAFTGLVFGTIFATVRQIWFVMIAHAAFDLTALALIYWNLETAVAHSIFR